MWLLTATENSLTIIGVIDSALKIGLGALIAGLASYFVARTNRSKDLDKERLTHQISMIQRIASEVDEFHTAMMDYVCTCPVTFKGQKCPIDDPIVKERLLIQVDLSIDRLVDNKNKRVAARDAAQNLKSARSSLSLLGYSDALEALAKYKSAAERFWLAVGDSATPMATDKFIKLKTSISEQYVNYYAEMTKVFPISSHNIQGKI